jgi:phage-related protein
MSDAQAAILVRAEMNDRLSAALQRINGQLSNTVRSLNGLKATSQSAVGATNAVGAAITQLSKHSRSLNGSLRSNVLSQQALSVSFKNSSIQANALSAQLGRLQSAGLNTTPIRAYITQLRAMDAMQKQVGNSMRAMQFQQMGTQLNAFSQRMTNSGTRISMGLTLPLVAFFRMGFSSFRALDKQVIRTTKLMDDSFDDTVANTTGVKKGYTDLQYAVKQLGDGLDKITSKWGVSRELVQGLAGDFAELGISAPSSLARLTELTVEFEKLGNIDITKAQSTIQAMFQTISRIRTDKGLDVTSEKSLKQMTAEIDGAIAFFNFAENKTTLSLSNIAEAFPEVTAAATSFGLNMQTTAAMLVPMIGASFQTGASANSIKVSLQRMIATTKQNADMLKDLSGTLGDEFVPALSLGATGIMELVTNYDLLQKKMSKADQLVFMSKLFGVRQGPRMEVAIAQMNNYDKQLKRVGSREQEMAQGVQDAVNTQLKLAGYDEIKVGNLVQINDLTYAAQEMNKDTGEYTAKALRIQKGQEVALFNLRNKNQALKKGENIQYDRTGKVIIDNTKKQAKQNKLGEEFNDIQTETGKLLTAQMYGKGLTESTKNEELKRVQNSVEVQYGKAREAAKSIARELTSIFGGILTQINPIIERVAKFFRELSDPIKKILGVLLIALAVIGPLMRTIGAVGQLGAMFSNARAAGIRKFKGNVVELNQSLMKTSDIALRIGGNFKKFGQDGKIFTSRKDAKRLEKLAPIIAKQDAGEELTAKERSKGGKYVRQLAGSKAVRDGTALTAQRNLYGLDQATKDYVRSLDPIQQTNKMVNELLMEHSRKTASIGRKAMAKLLKIRGASNNATPFYPTPTGAAIPPPTPFYPTPTGAAIPTPTPITSAVGGITTLRDILSQILSVLQAIQACVCNAKAATTGRPSPAASGAPTNAPPSGLSGSVVTSVKLGQKPATATGTSAPADAAATAASQPDVRKVKRLFDRPRTLPMVSPDVVNNNIPTPASLLPKPDIPAVKEKLPLWMSKGPSEKRDAAKAKLDLAAKGARGSIDIALGSSLKDAAQSVMVSIGKKPVAPVTNPIPAAIGEATTAAQESVASGVRKVKRLLNSPATGTTGPIPAAVETAVVGAEKVVAEAVVEGAKKKAGRPKGSTNKPKASAPVAPPPPVMAGDPFAVAAQFGGLGSDPMIKAKVKIVQSVNDIIVKAHQTGGKLGRDFTAIGKDIIQTLNMQEVGKNSYAVTKEALISLFKTLGVQVPADLAKVADLINKQTGEVLATSAAGVARLAASIKVGTTGVAIGAGSNLITGQEGNPFRVQQLNTGFGKAMETGGSRTSPAVIAERKADAPVAIADQKNDEERLRRRVEELKGRIVRVQQIGEKIDIKVAAILEEKRAVKDVNIKAKLEARIQRLQQHARVLNDYEAEIAEAIERGTRTLTGARATGTGFQIAQGRRSSPDGSGRPALPSMQTARRLAYKVPAFGEIAPSYLDVAYGSRGTKGRDSALFKERMSLAPSREIDPEVKAAKADQIAAGKIKLAAAKRYAASLKEFPILKPSEQPTSTRSDGGPVVNRKMTQDDLLRVNRKEISETQSLISKLEERISGIQSRISEINNQARTPGGKPAALRPLNTALKEIEGQIKEAKKQLDSLTTLPAPVSPRQAKADIRRKNQSERSALIDRMGFDPNRIEKMPKYLERATAPDISPSARPKSLSAGVQSGATTLGNINSQLSATLQIPTAVLDQFYQTLKIQGKGLAEVASNAGLQATDDLVLLKQELLKIGLTVEQAIAKPAESLKQLQAAKFEKGGDVQALFQRLVMYARDVADKGVQEAFDLTKQRLDAAKARAGGAAKPVAPKTAPATPAASSRAEYGFGLPRGTDEAKESGTQKGLAKEVADRIRTTRKSTEDFLLYEKKTLEYIAKEFGIKGASKIKAKDLVVKLNEVFKSLDITVEKAIVNTAVAPVTAATNAVNTNATTTNGAGSLEVSRVVKAGNELTVAVEKSVGTAAKAVERAAAVTVSTNAYLEAMKAGVQSPLAPRTVGGSGAKATGTTPAVAVNKPYSAPYLAQINSLTTSAEFAAAADTIGFDLRLMKDATLKQLQQMVKNIEIALRSVNASAIDAQFGTLFGGNLAKALEQVEEAIRQKLVKEVEKVKTVTAAVTAVPVAPAPPVAPARPASSSIPLSPEGSKSSGVVANSSTKAMLDVARSAPDSKSSGVVVNPATKAMLDAARAAAETVAAVASSYKPQIIRESGRIVVDAERNLVRAIEEKLIQTGQLVNRITSDIIATGKPKLDVPVGTAKALIGQMDKDIVAQSKARAEAEKARVKAEMDARIRQNVFESARIRTLTGGAGRFAPPPPPPTMMGRLFDGAKDGVRGIGRRARSSIIGAAMAPSIATPKQLFSGETRMPDSAEITGTIAKIANPVRIGTMLGQAFLSPATAIAKKVSSPSAIQKVNDSIENTINRFNLFFRKPVIKTGLFETRVGTSRQTIKAGLERDDVARGVDPTSSRQQRIINKTANRTATNNISVSRFEVLANGMVNKVKSFGANISGAIKTANSVIDPALGVATLISGQIIKAPVTFAKVYTKAVITGHKIAFDVISKGLTLLSAQTSSAISNFAATNFAQTTIVGKSLLYTAQTLQKGLVGLASGIGNLPTTIGTGLNLTVNAIKNPKASIISAGKGLLSAASTIKDGAGKLTQAAMLATAAGAKMGAGAVANAAMAPARGVKTMFVGGSTFVPQGQDAAGNAIATKKGGLFRRSVTQTTDATTGMMTEQRGKGMMGKMKGGIGKGVMGGIKGLGTAAGSMSSMMLYQLGPAGMALQGPMNKVITLLTRTKLAFFGVTLPIMLVIGAIFLLKKTFSAYGDKTTGVAENFSKAFKAIMAVVNMVKRAFFDFFASLFGGAESSGEATGNIADAVTNVAEKVRKFAEAFKAFFEKTILPAIYSFLSGLSMVIKGIFSFVSNLVKFVIAIVSFFRGGGDKAKEAMGNAFKGMLKALVNVMKGLLKMVLPVLNLLIKAVFKVIELIVQGFEWLVIGVINLIRHMVNGIINLVFSIIKAYVFIIDKIIELFVLLETTAIKISTAMVIAVIKIFFGIVKGTVAVVKGIISIWAKLPAGVGKGIGMIGTLIAGLMRGIGDKLGGLWGIGPKLKSALYSVADGFETASNAVEGVGGAATAKLESGIDAIFTPLENGISGIQNRAIGLVNGISGALIRGVSSLNGVGDAVMGVVQGVQNALLGSVKIAANTANAFIGGFSDGIASLGSGITDWLSGLVDGNDIKQGIGDAIRDGVENGAKDPSAANEAGKSIAKAIGEGIKSLKDNFYDKVISNLSDSLGKLKDQVTKALEKQKDQSLKFFDDQIAAIDALAAADAELTAEKQRQEDERLRIAERALQRDSYLKNRALAIYEGRIDDARTLGLEEAKNQQDFNRETAKNAKDAEAAAKAKNIDAAKAVITNQREAASIQFDSVLEDYQAFLENVGRNGTLTQAELTTQFNELRARATTASTSMQTAFQGYYNALPGLIAANTTPTVGFFTGSMDALIAAAQGRFGLDSGSTDPTSLLGVTNGMLGNMGLAYTNGFASVVAPAYNDGQELLADIARQFADPSATNPKSAAGIYATAIANATAAVRAEFMKMKTDASSAFAEVVAGINDELKRLAITKAINDAKEELKNTGGGTAPSGGSATSPATGVTGPTASIGFGPGTLTEAGFLSAAGVDKLFKLNDKSQYIKAAKAALAFYGYTGFDVGTDVMG